MLPLSLDSLSFRKPYLPKNPSFSILRLSYRPKNPSLSRFSVSPKTSLDGRYHRSLSRTVHRSLSLSPLPLTGISLTVNSLSLSLSLRYAVIAIEAATRPSILRVAVCLPVCRRSDSPWVLDACLSASASPDCSLKMAMILAQCYQLCLLLCLLLSILLDPSKHTYLNIIFSTAFFAQEQCLEFKEEFDYESLCRKLEQQVDYLTAKTERQNKQIEDDKQKMERKINECQNSFIEAERNLAARSERFISMKVMAMPMIHRPQALSD
ncbi:hypothetical protein Syun_000881 [Stephania yunnanensis]|uniref:Uncharacterized protein n=1 Tax=Stephania yunnanensis TaxID=152371 RepID=A0AAP0LCX1_9MAGN